MADSDVDALVIHAVYLLNAGSEDPEIREKTLTSLIASLQAGDALGAVSVVLHPGSALKGEVAPAIARAGEVFREALAESEHCALHLENTAGAGGTLGRSFEELAALIDAGGARQAPRDLPGLLPPVRLRLRHPHRGGPDLRARRVRPHRRPGPPRLAAPQRLGQRAGHQPRSPRRHRQGRDRRGRLRGLPVGAALRDAAGDPRDARAPTRRAHRRRRSRWRASCASGV